MVNRFKKYLEKILLSVSEVEMMIVLAEKVQGFYYMLGGPQPKRVGWAHSWADSESIVDIDVL